MLADRVLKLSVLICSCPWLWAGDQGDSWVIPKMTGTWHYREGSAGERKLEGTYFRLRPDGEVMCEESDPERCKLYYLIDDGPPVELPVKPLRNKRWTSLKNLTAPKVQVLAPPAAFVEMFRRAAQRGGSRDGSGCGGDLVLRAPMCGETADISDFRIRWSAIGAEQTKQVSILVERVDGSSASFRDSAPASGGEYAADRLLEFLKRQQGRNEVVDISVRVMAGNGRSAVRLVHLPPSVRTEQYDLRIKAIQTTDPFLRSIQFISLAAEEGMWSKAADVARLLMDLAPGATVVQEYALAGLCKSDFEEEKVRLRRELPIATYDSICGSTATAAVGPAAAAPAAPLLTGPPRKGSGGATRLGIALVIGNSDYFDLPLNSVKEDIKGMNHALTGLGFQVTVRQNLRNPGEFQQALGDFLKKSEASPDDILLVYYSGHGLQLDGKAQLLGTGFSSTARVAEDVRSNAQSVGDLLSEMERAAPGTRVLIVEACRNNVFASSSTLDGQNPRSGIALMPDVPNTFVMFANRPGAATPARSEYGLRGPFTESLIHALQNSSGEIKEVFSLAQQKTNDMNKGQQPDLLTSNLVDRVLLRQQEERQPVNRAADLLNSAGLLYRNKAWEEFLVTVERARPLAMSAGLQERLNKEVTFVGLVITAEKREESRDWKEAAVSWQGASNIFPSRQWVAMKAGVAWLMADDLREAVRVLAALSASGDGEPARQAGSILRELLKAFQELEADARSAAQAANKPPAQEFELVDMKE